MSLPTWVSTEETKPAPAELLLLQAFVNTRESDRGTDLLLDPGAGSEWLTAVGLVSSRSPVSAEQLSLARAVRESIRALLVANNQGPHPTAAELQPLVDLLGANRLQLQIGSGGLLELDAENPGHFEGRLVQLLMRIRDAQQNGTWLRLKACRNSECCWAFYDRSHSRRGTWCDMAVCGNRIKNRNLRQRRDGHGPRGVKTPIVGDVR